MPAPLVGTAIVTGTHLRLFDEGMFDEGMFDGASSSESFPLPVGMAVNTAAAVRLYDDGAYDEGMYDYTLSPAPLVGIAVETRY